MKKLLLLSIFFFSLAACLPWQVAHGQTASLNDNTSAYNYKKKDKKEKKQRKHLVWCGWKSGFHWDTPGQPNKKQKVITANKK